MNSLIKAFEYNGNNVTFKTTDGVVYANATEMAKPFGKRTVEYLSNNSTKEFINALKISQSDNSHLDLYLVQHGGSNPGTWMHEDLALHFAQWLNPFFAVWCNKKIKELLTTGKAELTDEEMTLMVVNKLQAKVEDLRVRNTFLLETVKEQAPKVQYVNDVLQSSTLIPVTIIASDLGMTAIALNNSLEQKGIQYKQGKTWILHARYKGKGYAKTRTHEYYDSEGKKQTKHQTYWTEKGRQFIHQLFSTDLDQTG